MFGIYILATANNKLFPISPQFNDAKNGGMSAIRTSY